MTTAVDDLANALAGLRAATAKLPPEELGKLATTSGELGETADALRDSIVEHRRAHPAKDAELASFRKVEAAVLELAKNAESFQGIVADLIDDHEALLVADQEAEWLLHQYEIDQTAAPRPGAPQALLSGVEDPAPTKPRRRRKAPPKVEAAPPPKIPEATVPTPPAKVPETAPPQAPRRRRTLGGLR